MALIVIILYRSVIIGDFCEPYNAAFGDHLQMFALPYSRNRTIALAQILYKFTGKGLIAAHAFCSSIAVTIQPLR